jgi:hypothetical protein
MDNDPFNWDAALNELQHQVALPPPEWDMWDIPNNQPELQPPVLDGFQLDGFDWDELERLM